MVAALVIGGAGTGKTTELLRLMEMTLSSLVKDPLRIGFVSFTRAARAEAASRAGDQFNISQEELEHKGWFRTIHSICHRVLGVGDELLTTNAASRKWIAEAVGSSSYTGVADIDGDISEAFEVSTEAGRALHIWDVSRAMLLPVRDVWERHDRVARSLTPSYETCENIIERYEVAKGNDGRWDFTDLLMRVAGKYHRITLIEDVEPEGKMPVLPVWFFDEQQDTSKLADLVCRRIILGSKWQYFVGDPFQSIYGWAGAESKHFLGLPVAEDKRRILDKSYRCSSAILEAGESILRSCTDYFDRGIKPVREGGEVETLSFLSGWEKEIDPTKDEWLLLARTNRQAFKISTLLDEAGIPWGPTQSNTNRSPLKASVVGAIGTLESGGTITGTQYQQILKIFPSRFENMELFKRGTKKKFEDDDNVKKFGNLNAEQLKTVGATDIFVYLVTKGREHWRTFIPDCTKIIDMCDEWGVDAIARPKIRVGTIHSAKGAEADNVAILTSQTMPIRAACEDDVGADEERRVWYVGATRGRNKLHWLVDYRDRLRFNPDE